jgi:signal transduction histidine kinase
MERLFVAGLLHDIGRLVVYSYASTHARNALLSAQKGSTLLYAAEAEILCFDHTRIGGLLLKKWNLSVSLENSVTYHHAAVRSKDGLEAAAIVQDLSTLARRGLAVTELINLNHIVCEYLKSPEHEKLKLYHPHVQVKANLVKDLLPILGSSVHLSKTVMNLVSNAPEAMSNGGTIHISTEPRSLDSQLKAYETMVQGDYAVLTVSDTCVGISPTDLEKIFEPLYTKKVMGTSGTGLGMAIVWGTVKDH